MLNCGMYVQVDWVSWGWLCVHISSWCHHDEGNFRSSPTSHNEIPCLLVNMIMSGHVCTAPMCSCMLICEFSQSLKVLKPYTSKETDDQQIAYLSTRATTSQYLKQDIHLASYWCIWVFIVCRLTCGLALVGSTLQLCGHTVFCSL